MSETNKFNGEEYMRFYTLFHEMSLSNILILCKILNCNNYLRNVYNYGSKCPHCPYRITEKHTLDVLT